MSQRSQISGSPHPTIRPLYVPLLSSSWRRGLLSCSPADAIHALIPGRWPYRTSIPLIEACWPMRYVELIDVAASDGIEAEKASAGGLIEE